MEFRKILRKLEPLMPQQVGRWTRLLDVARSEVTELIERQIVHTAYQTLGDFRNRLLLSLPPENKAKGVLNLGTVIYESPKWPAGISLKELTQNLAVFGRSGAGKTNIAFHLLQQLIARKVPFLFLDWKRTARHLIPILGGKLRVYTAGRSISPLPFNPFIVPAGVEGRVYVNHVVDVLGDAYTLGDGARSVLQQAISACYQGGNDAPLVGDVLKALEEIPDKQRVTGWKISATRALESVEFACAGGKDRKTQRAMAHSLLKDSTVIELDALSQGAKKFLVPLLCFWVYSVQLASEEREQLRFVIFLEEAHHVLYRQQAKTKEGLLEMLLRQCRELGLAFIVVDQHPHLMSSAALGNCYTTICLNQKDPADVNKAAGLSLVDEADRNFFSMLPVGQGVVKLQDRWRKPFLVQFPLLDIEKGRVTDEVLKQLRNGSLTLSALRKRQGIDSVAGERSRESDIGLQQGAIDLFNDVLQHPQDGVDKRYKRLQLSADRGNRYKQQLVTHGLVIPERVKTGRTFRVVLRVSAEARRIFRLHDGDKMHGSPIHEFWKHYYGRLYKERGYSVQLEAPRKNGHVDILARKASESVAIEVETGKSDVVHNVRQDFLEGFQTIVVVATDENALRTVESQLAKAGLILPRRLRIILRNEGEKSHE